MSYNMFARRLLVAASILLVLSHSATPTTAAPATPTAAAPAPTYRIFATREGLVGHTTANGHVIRPRDRFVALPSWSVLSSRGGREFQVRITYKGRSAVAPVWDVGPWNTRDDYWNPHGRRYSDLPVGLPMAQAAYQHGYNGGRDEYGRRIAHPNGIDIADGTFWDDLGMVDNDWVEVTFLWLGTDPGPASAPHAEAPQAEAPPDTSDAAAVVDNGGDWYDATPNEWQVAPCGARGNHNWTYTTARAEAATHQASWTGQLAQAGTYEVLAYIPGCGPAATSGARYAVEHSGGVDEVVIDQHGARGGWASLGTYFFDTAAQARVVLNDLTDKGGQAVRFDAVKWVPRADNTAPSSMIEEVRSLDDGGLLVRWAGHDDLSGVRAYDVQWQRLPDGPWTDWHVGAAIEQDRFIAPQPGDYGLRVRARDRAGNVEPWRAAPDATTSAP
jgi:hypothetical protein